MRRSLAQECCDFGLIRVNGRPAKSSKEIKVNDEITINRRDRSVVVRVKLLPEKKQVSKQLAGDLYEIVENHDISAST